MENATKTASGVFATILIGFIVIVFMFSGAESTRGTPDTIAKVGSHVIKYNDYQNSYERLSRFYSMIYNGNNPLTSKQVEQLGLKHQALQQAITQKLQLILGEKVGVTVSDTEIAEAVMNFEEPGPDGKPVKIFYTNGKFDRIKYEQILTGSGRFTPQTFEKLVRAQVEGEAIAPLFESVPVSNKYVAELVRFKSTGVQADVAKVNMKGFNKFLTISTKEVDDYLADKNNAVRVEALFKDRKPRLDQPEQVKARHILLTQESKIKAGELRKKLTKKNFEEMAKKYSAEPGADKSGGDLGWFARGRMVKAFDTAVFKMKVGEISTPVKTEYGTHLILLEGRKAEKLAEFKDYERKIAIEQIKNSKNEEAQKLAESVVADIKTALQNGQVSKAEKIAKKYNLEFVKNASISKLERAAGNVMFTGAQAQQIFATAQGQTFTIEEEGLNTYVIKNLGPAKIDLKLEDETRLLSQGLKSKFAQEMLKHLQDNTRIKIYQKL